VTIHFGFMEDPNVEKVLKGMVARADVPLDPDNTKWLVHVVHEKIMATKVTNLFNRLRFGLYSLIHKNTDTADHYFGLGDDEPLTIEVVPVYFK
jgi:K+ transporter